MLDLLTIQHADYALECSSSSWLSQKTLRACSSLLISSLCPLFYWKITFPVWSNISAFIGRIILNFKKCYLSEACKRCREKNVRSRPAFLLVSQSVEGREGNLSMRRPDMLLVFSSTSVLRTQRSEDLRQHISFTKGISCKFIV